MANINIAAFDGTTDAGNIQIPARGVASIDIASGGAQLDDDDTVIIAAEGNDDIIIVMRGAACTTPVVTVAAGDIAPSPHAGKGAATVTVPADDVLLYVPEAGRHVKEDGTIRLTVSACDQVFVWVFRMAGGFVGVPIMNQRTIPAAPTD